MPPGGAAAWLLQDPRILAGTGLGLAAAAGCYWQWVIRNQEPRRPFQIRDLAAGETVADPEAELTRVVEWLQDAVVRPLDARLPGRPFEHDLFAFPFTPLVMVVGNHSAGKSTFINKLLGRQVQETGVAPTDDGFTVLQRHPKADEVEDGPTLLSCPENRPFKELQRFGQPFWGHFRRKRLLLPEDTTMPYGLQIIDTPGMIDMPVQSNNVMGGGRGYNFLEVVRWFAKRADLILLLFDPDKPGTTGEALDVLTRALTGLDHKFVIILNKVDQLDSSVDFARAYGTLSWALSKVIPRKDIPMIYTMYNAGVAHEPESKKHNLPLEAFQQKRQEVMAEVLRAKPRHWDNVITSTECTLRHLEMVATITAAVRNKARGKRLELQMWSLAALGVPGFAGGKLLRTWAGPKWALPAIGAAYAAVCGGVFWFFRDYCRQFEQLQIANLDDYFEEAYAWYFIHADAEDLRGRWAVVRPRVVSILRAAPSIALLPPLHRWELARIEDCLEKDVWYLRLLAKLLRGVDSA